MTPTAIHKHMIRDILLTRYLFSIKIRTQRVLNVVILCESISKSWLL